MSEYWIDKVVFDREIIKGQDKKVFYPLLVENGFILKGSGKGYTQSRRPAKENPQNFIVVPASAFNNMDNFDENE